MRMDTGKHPLFGAKVGDALGSIELTVTEDMVERNLWGMDDYNPWYLKDSPFGGRIAPPAAFINFLPSLFYRYYAHPDEGTLLVDHRLEFFNPLKVGKKVTINGRFAERYHREGRDFFTGEFTVVDEDGVVIARDRRTVCSPMHVRRNK